MKWHLMENLECSKQWEIRVFYIMVVLGHKHLRNMFWSSAVVLECAKKAANLTVTGRS